MKPVIRSLLAAAALAAGFSRAEAEAPTGGARFPLSASANGRYLVDSAGKPFFYQADTPWMMLLQLTLPEAEEYIADRKTKGFTALQIMMTGFFGMKNREGQLPFGPENDLTKPNEAYFTHTDRVIQMAADKGMFLMIAPMWSGCCGEGWAGKAKNGDSKPLNLNGEANAREWGEWLGKRYGKYDHIAWMMGGDKNPEESHELIRQMARGIHEAAPRQLMTVHNAPGNSSAAFYDDQPWLALNAAYTYEEVHEHISGEWRRTKPVRPVFLSESGYEHESNDGRGGAPFRLRRQAYGAVLSGALAGHAYGHRDLWRVNPAWRASLQDPGSKQMTHVRQLFATREWWKLEPEPAEKLVTHGRGKVGDVDYMTAAIASDRSMAMVYIPQARKLTVDLSTLAAPVKARWFDPADGNLKPVQANPIANVGTRDFSPPEKNASGDSDWILLLETFRESLPVNENP